MKPITEQVNPRTKDIDRRSTLEIVTLINYEDKTVAEAVSLVLEPVAQAVDLIAKCMDSGGRLYYVGTGTSGQLGVLDARSALQPSASVRTWCRVLSLEGIRAPSGHRRRRG